MADVVQNPRDRPLPLEADFPTPRGVRNSKRKRKEPFPFGFHRKADVWVAIPAFRRTRNALSGRLSL